MDIVWSSIPNFDFCHHSLVRFHRQWKICWQHSFHAKCCFAVSLIWIICHPHYEICLACPFLILIGILLIKDFGWAGFCRCVRKLWLCLKPNTDFSSKRMSFNKKSKLFFVDNPLPILILSISVHVPYFSLIFWVGCLTNIFLYCRLRLDARLKCYEF